MLLAVALAAAGYAVGEAMPPDPEEVVHVWHALGSNDVFGALARAVEEHGDADTKTSMREWLALHPPSGAADALDALVRRDQLLLQWLEYLQHRPLVVLPTLCDLPPPLGEHLTREGQAWVLRSMRAGLLAAALGLPALAVPVGSHGPLRTGVQIMRH
jgi:amidase